MVLYIAWVFGAHAVSTPRLLNHAVSSDINMIDKLTANTMTTGANITLIRSPIQYLRIGISLNPSPIESLNDRLSTKNGDKAITTHKIHTLTNITRAVSRIGKSNANAKSVFITASMTSARSSPLLVWILNCEKLRIEEYSVISGHIIPLLESSRFFMVSTPVSLNVDRAGFCGIAYNGAIPQPSLTSRVSLLLISNIFCCWASPVKV